MPNLTGTDRETIEAQTRLVLAGLQARTQELGRIAEATTRMLAAPDAGLIQDTADFHELARELVPRWHFAMLNDDERNDALAVALERIVPRDGIVLDIGAGTGLLAMMAVRAGAGHVFSCEANPLMAELARQVVAGQGYADTVTVLSCRSDELRIGHELPRRVDAVISEIVDCGLIGEGILPTLRHAREHLLVDGGVMLPRRATVLGALMQSEVAASLNRVGQAGGFDMSRLNAFSTVGHFPFRLNTWPHRLLSDPVELASFEFRSGPLGPGGSRPTVRVTQSGTAHAVVAWFEMDLGAGVTLRNSLENVSSHWVQAIIPFPEPVEVVAGTPLTLDVTWTETRFSVK